MSTAESLEKLVGALGKLPGVGRRTAERMAMKLVRDPDGVMKDLVTSLQEAMARIKCCSRCGNITTVEQNPCGLCTSASRDGSTLCVVEDPYDITTIERSGGFGGRYHALMGKISPMRGDGPGELRLKSLVERIEKEKFQEVILALSTDVEGDSTASYIADLLKGQKVKVTRLAFGMPAGSGIAYSDPVTLSRALKGRVNAE
jgi:recombination protein RecR